MPEQTELKNIIESAVAKAVSKRLESLQADVTREVLSSLSPLWQQQLQRVQDAQKAAQEAGQRADDAAASQPAPGTGPTDVMNAAIATIHDAASQTEILKALLEGVAKFSPRTALFVMKAGTLSGWQSRGFQKENAVKGLTMDGATGLAGRAVKDKEPVSAAANEFSGEFIKANGNPVDGNAIVLPLVVREKVAAVVYADAGTTADGRCDTSAAQILVRSASNVLEILALRKFAGGAAAAEAEPEPVAAAPAPAPPAAAPAAPAPKAAAADVPDGLSQEDQEVHKKAKRFAKLLVDEIKLYNQSKVNEGRQNKDLYQRLKEDIDKSRATFDKRYGTTSAAAAGYFTSEVIRILADNDPSNMGGGFTR